ncbi:MAG: helix-turn-helix domain-containing protein [Lapillicoccus sp.]
MAYTERLVAPGVVVWSSTGSVGEQRILPDGCLDLVLDGERLLVAGPDTAARVHTSLDARPMTGVRLHGGRGPTRLGVPADLLTDRTLLIEEVWGDRRGRALTRLMLRGPERELAAWGMGPGSRPGLGARSSRGDDGFGPELLRLLGGGLTVAAAAEALGYSARQLHRRTLPAFGYGPQHLRRVLRLQRALAAVDRGLAWASVAAGAGYADQAHLARDVRALTGVTPTALRRERDVRSVQDAA